MVHLHLSEEECAVLRELTTLRLQDLGHEIHHTDSREFKAGLRHEEKLIRGLLERPGPEAAAAAR